VGAANVLRVYHSWRRHLDDRPFCLLAYMALIARDQDAEPWFGQGHAALAELALGMDVPTEAKQRDAVLRKVRRHITPLFAAGAICTRKRARYGRYVKSQVQYRLHLDAPCDCEPQVTQRPKAARRQAVDNPPPYRSLNDLQVSESIGHSVVVHRSLIDRLQVTERPTKEKEEEEELRTSKAQLRNGELWKASPVHLNGSAEPAEPATRRRHTT
jgi:hypothetical protein